ncbi:hypothetical protein ACH4U6_35720 [Streptomyces netropsis]|uniref:hypothetical protein n=1 Tax=Streptomyces netropsis TaxID=55404 RepID=UPI0037A1A118
MASSDRGAFNPEPAAATALDLIGRDFTAAEVNTKYADDITYLPVSGAKPLYLAPVIDLASRRLGNRRLYASRARHRGPNDLVHGWPWRVVDRGRAHPQAACVRGLVALCW